MLKTNPASIQRTKLLRLFVDRDLSPDTQMAISKLMNGMTDQRKEELACKMINIINSSKTEEEILSKMLI